MGNAMRVHHIDRDEFRELVYSRADEFLDRINAPEAFVVKGFYPSDAVLAYRNEAFKTGIETEASWHPLHDDCPDYHRFHDNYPKAHVKQKMHGFYYHHWYSHNRPKFDFFSEIFAIKNHLAGYSENAFFANIPSDGFIPRINIHHYPRGGGFQSEHIDPVGKHAQIQTLIAASEIGKDYQVGGVYGRTAPDAPPSYLDSYLQPGDLLVMSPGIQHGVAAIDPDESYSSNTNDGRWMILPLIVGSDYPNPDVIKPKQVAAQ